MDFLWSCVSTFALIIILFLAVRWSLGHGVKIPIGGGYYFRRWVEPTNHVLCKSLVEELQNLCKDSIGSLLPHPVIQGHADELKNKIVFICYDKFDQAVMFNMGLKANVPNVKERVFHIGLVMVANKAKGKGLQKLAILNIALNIISYCSFRYTMTDIGDSPSAARMLPLYLDKTFPNYLKPDTKPEKEYINIFKHVIDVHRKDMGVSSNAVPDFDTFVVKQSNEPTGGGCAVLVSHSSERRSRDHASNDFFYKHVDPSNYDEMFVIGRVNFSCFINLILAKITSPKI